MQCPSCQGTLEPQELGPRIAIVDQCTVCKGLWMDKGELDSLDESIWINVEVLPMTKLSGERTRSCPRCAKTLEALSPEDSPELVLDRCPSCKGFWLDYGELDHVRDLASRSTERILRSDDRISYSKRPGDWSAVSWTVYLFKGLVGR